MEKESLFLRMMKNPKARKKFEQEFKKIRPVLVLTALAISNPDEIKTPDTPDSTKTDFESA